MLDVNKTLWGLLLIAVAAGGYRVSLSPRPAAFAEPPKPQVASASDHEDAPHFAATFASSRLHKSVHAGSLVELRDGRVRAVWFSGTREGAPDVEIRSAVFNPDEGRWSAEQIITDRSSTQRALWRRIKKLGNPVIGRAADGALKLFYVSVSQGGWSGSAINVMSSGDDGATWGAPRRLITSPFINVSTLVKGAPYLYADGTLGLPVYHELFAKFGELIRISSADKVIAKHRVSVAGDGGLQPVLLIESARRASVLMRYAGDAPRRVLMATSKDRGRHWSASTKTELANPNAAVSALVLPDGSWLAALNNQERGRHALSLHHSNDRGRTWKKIYQLESQRAERNVDEATFAALVARQINETGIAHGSVADAQVTSIKQAVCRKHECRFRFSYPYLIQTRGGDFHLVYTYNRAFIKHVVFNSAWLRQRTP